MNQLQSWKGVGFAFGLEDSDDGLPCVKVIDPWHHMLNPGLKMADTLQIKLQPYTTYAEAQEIAAFINRRLENGNLPLIRVQA